ncbi:MAG: divalent-cation tolerance protein CutA [Pseudomonadota bacterium]
MSPSEFDGNRIVTVYCSFGDMEEARSTARKIVQEELAACANILGETRAIYRWHGELREDGEAAVLFKTRVAALPALKTRIIALHSYDLPGITVWRAEDSEEAFGDWIIDQTGGQP